MGLFCIKFFFYLCIIAVFQTYIHVHVVRRNWNKGFFTFTVRDFISCGQTLNQDQISDGHGPAYEMAHHDELSA